MNILKKTVLTMLAVICLSFMLASCAISPHAGTQTQNQKPVREEVSNNTTDALRPGTNYQPEVGDVVAYDLSQKAFQEFLLQPSIGVITRKCDDFSVYRKSTEKKGNVKLKYYGLNRDFQDISISGYFRIGGWPVYLEFIDFMNNRENFEQILSERGINEELLSCVIITHKDNQPILPGTVPIMCIWLHTNKGDYFLEYNAYLYKDLNDKHFLYDFYDLKGYSQKY